MARLLGKTSDLDDNMGEAINNVAEYQAYHVAIAWIFGIITAISAIIIWVYLTI